MAYIHLNPLRAGQVETLEQLASYPLSGHAVLMGKLSYEWMESDYVLQFFGDSAGKARQAYLEFIEGEIGVDREKELMGGGLLRSHGGWSKVQSMRRQKKKVLSDERILGGDGFVREVLKQAKERQEDLLPEIERLQLFDKDIEQACDKAGVTVSFLRSGSRSGQLPSLRKELARKAVYEYGISLAETGRKLGVTTNAVSFMLKNA